MKNISTFAFLFACPLTVLQGGPLYSVTSLGALYPGQVNVSSASDINVAGDITGVSSNHAAIWHNGAWSDLGLGDSARGYSINSSGVVAGVTTSSGTTGPNAFIAGNGTITYPGHLAGNPPYSDGMDINDSGVVVGMSNLAVPGNSGIGHGFVYSGGVMADLNAQVAVASGGDHSFTIGLSPYISSEALGINNSGQITGQIGTDHFAGQAFLLTDGVMQIFGSLDVTNPTNNTVGWRINDSGQVVGWGGTASEESHAFLFVNGVMTDLNDLISADLNITLMSAEAINDSGQIVANSSNQAYLLTPISEAPEPASWSLLLGGWGLAVLFGIRTCQLRHSGASAMKLIRDLLTTGCARLKSAGVLGTSLCALMLAGTVVPLTLNAGTTYTFVSTSHLDSRIGSVPLPSGTGVVVTVSFSVPTPLAPNLNSYVFTPEWYLFSDTVDTLTNENSFLQSDLHLNGLEVSTNAFGNITFWDMQAGNSFMAPPNDGIMGCTGISDPGCRSIATGRRTFDGQITSIVYFGGSNAQAFGIEYLSDQWSQATTTASAPEPGTWLLFVGGGLVLTFALKARGESPIR